VLHGYCCLAAAAAPHPAYAVSPSTPAANLVSTRNNDAVCQLTRLCISVKPPEHVSEMQSVMGMSLSKGNLSSAMHHNHELLVVKQRVEIRICHGAGISQVGAKPVLLLLQGSSGRRETC